MPFVSLCYDFHVLLQREGKALPEASLPFHRAMPSLTHMALIELERAGILKFVISQVRLFFSFWRGFFFSLLLFSNFMKTYSCCYLENCNICTM